MQPQSLDSRVDRLEKRVEILDEIHAGDEETRHLMRVLHEDVIARLAILQERNGGPS
jgi:hypothetical protein